MNKKIILMIIFILLVLSSFGCKKSDGKGPSDRGEPIEPWEMDYHKGTQGLVMGFVENQPPNKIWENTPFQVAIELKNKGAEDIEKAEGLIYISGFKYITLNKEKSFELEGKDQFNPEGGFEIITFPAQALEVAKKDQTDSFVVTSCYRYKTSAGANICINPTVIDIAKIKEGECKPGSVSVAGGQGAPVAVTKIEQEYIPVKIAMKPGDPTETRILLKIHISNSGNGKLVKYDAYDKKCRESGVGIDAEKELNVIRVKDVRFSKYALSTYDGKEYRVNCTGFVDEESRDLKIPLSGDGILSCSASLYEDLAFTTPLTVELEYGYTDYITKAITVKDIQGT